MHREECGNEKAKKKKRQQHTVHNECGTQEIIQYTEHHHSLQSQSIVVGSTSFQRTAPVET